MNSATSAAVTTPGREIFCGAQAAIFATGRENKHMPDQRMSYREEEFDYGNQLGVAAGSIYGITKTRFNSADFSTIVMSSYATAP